jgi:hypothetical protein
MRLHENLSLRVCLDSNSLSLVCSKLLYPEREGECRALKSLREMQFEKQWSDEAFCVVLGTEMGVIEGDLMWGEI